MLSFFGKKKNKQTNKQIGKKNNTKSKRPLSNFSHLIAAPSFMANYVDIMDGNEFYPFNHSFMHRSNFLSLSPRFVPVLSKPDGE